MGCGEAKDEVPCLLCFFEFGNENQKNFCLKLKDNFKHEQSIRFEIKSAPEVKFSVQFKYKGKIYDILTTYNEGEDVNIALQKMYQMLDENKAKETKETKEPKETTKQ